MLNLAVIAGTISHSIDAAQVTHGSDLLTVAAGHGWRTGERILVTEVGTLPTGLSTATQYWVIRISDTTFKLASSHANALAGTVVNLTGNGTAANTYASVEKLSGPDANQAYVQGTAVGVYKIFFINVHNQSTSFAVAPKAFATSRGRDSCVSVSSEDASYVIFNVDDLDETAALEDGFFNALIIGSDVSDSY